MSEMSRPEPTKELERRASIRYLCVPSKLCHSSIFGEDERWPAQVRDISTDGLGLVFKQPLEPGIILGIELNNPDADLSYTISAKVVHCQQDPDGSWRIGCAFIRKLSNDEVQALL